VTLRRRLLLTVVLTAVPLVLGFLWLRGALVAREDEEALRAFASARMEAGGRERCEADPAGFSGVVRPREDGGPRRGAFPGGPRPGWRFRPVRLHAYDAGLRSADPAAPPLPPSLRRALSSGAEVASADFGPGRLVAVRVASEGPCAVLAAFRPRPPREGLPGLVGGAIVLCSAFLGAVWLAAGPVVRRIQALAGDVREAAARRYETPVPVRGRDEVAALAASFNAAAAEVRAQIDALQQREQTLRAFIANTTHDLMLPLTVLQGHLARLRRGEDGGGPVVASAAEEADYLASLVHNLAAAAKLEAGEELGERHPLDLGAVVERSVAAQRTLAASRGIELAHAVPEAPLFVSGDVTLVEQAVRNLVHNAVRHNRPGGHVGVVLDEAGPGSFRLRVIDDGPGVAPAEMERLGERRFRADDARHREPAGQGLGLSIAREVAERHGFTLTFSASEPSGLVAELGGPRLPPAAPCAPAH
jgi:signal transduction histidine kinase